MLGLRCCPQALSSCSKQGLLFSCSALASHYAGFSRALIMTLCGNLDGRGVWEENGYMFICD